MKREVRRILGLLLSVFMMLEMVYVTGFEVQAATYGENLIKNSNFMEEDLSVWKTDAGNADISVQTAPMPIYDNISTYGVISNRTTPYECFSQDVTAVVRNGRTYAFSFYAMLSSDYEGAPANQREVNFAPYVTVNGQTSYLGSYSPQISGTSSQVLTPNQWTKFEGTFSINYSAAPQKVVIRLLEQGSNYGAGTCVKGDYYVTGVTLREIMDDTQEASEVPILYEAVAKQTDAEFIMGTAIDSADLADEEVMSVVTTHFNAVTLGNALKPDALFGYSNSWCPGTQTVTFNGESLLVPKFNFSRAEDQLDDILAWNQAHPDKQIKIRGHVLVWHSQTPEWFFHEDYIASKAYVSKEVMNKRLEWYIATVLEHFTGEDSPYKDLFYSWDVVNEAVSDSTGTYRSDTENPQEPLTNATHGNNSSWWHVYESNEYIINAFRYANKYAPADLDLYYNDYNEFSSKKRKGIEELLKAVLAAEGTRLDGMGMQGHYGMSYPDFNELEKAMRSYASLVDVVQITELDMRASDSYDGSTAAKETEYYNQALRYQTIFEMVKKLRTEGLNISGITVWGVVDKYSWLQSSSNVGGGADGTQTQCPLLFDNSCRAKPAYWAFVDPIRMAKNPFADVPKTAWYYPYVKTIYDNGQVSGVGTDSDGAVIFKPLDSITREQFVQILFKIEGIDKDSIAYTNRFTDVPNPAEDSSAYYAQAVLWAESKGITAGISETEFGVGNVITREQLATMFYKYATWKGYDVSGHADISGYPDKLSVDSWAQDSVSWAVSESIISGKPGADGQGMILDPDGEATRAECITMLKSFLDNYK